MALFDSLKTIGQNLFNSAAPQAGGYLDKRLKAKAAPVKTAPVISPTTSMPKVGENMVSLPSVKGITPKTTPATSTYTPPDVNKPLAMADLTSKTYNVSPSTSISASESAAAKAAAATGGSAPETKTETPRDKMLGQLSASIEKLGTKSERVAQIEKEQGLLDKREQLAAINDKYNRVEREYELRERRLIEQNPEGKLLPNAELEISNMRRQRAQELGDIALEQLAAQGNVDAIKDTVDSLVKAEFEPLSQQIEAMGTFIQLAGDDLTESEKIILQAEVDKQQYEYESGVKSAVAAKEAESFLKVYQSQGIDAVPKDSQADVLALANQRGVVSPAEKAAQERSLKVHETAKELSDLVGGGSLAISGSAIQRGFGFIGGLFGSNRGDIIAKMDSLKALLSVDAIKDFKGLGPMSDREFQAASAAATSLTREMSEEAFAKEVRRIQEHVENALLPLPSTSEEDKKRILTERAIRHANERGYTPSQEELTEIVEEEYNQITGMRLSSGGNVPQRNNNPGNIKAGGLADELAIDTDEQGHLVFPDAETGKLALRKDLEAKIGGRSSYLPENPTISQLGSVYAEDPNWGNKVASILGVSPSTKTKSVNLDRLMDAIMTQEGYFA